MPDESACIRSCHDLTLISVSDTVAHSFLREKTFHLLIYPDYSAKPVLVICSTVNHLDVALPVWLRI